MILSVVIPVYNVEKYLRQCVDSVLNQHLQDYEIILVDDGSKDNSGRICDDYKKTHDNVDVIHKENGGLSSARNTGIKAASGRYIVFLDSDDWWNPDIDFRLILNRVSNNENVEMFLLSSVDYIEGEGLYRRNEHERLNNIRTDTVKHYYSDLLKNGNLEVHACTKIMSKDFLINNNLFFKEGLLGEDNEWMIRVLRCLKRVEIINLPIYVYRRARPNSISNSIKKKNIADLLEIVANSMEYYKKNVDAENKNNELNFCSYLWFCALGLSNQIKESEYKETISVFKKTSQICTYSNSYKNRLAYRVYRLFGLSICRRLLGSYLKIKKHRKLHTKKYTNQ